MDKATTDNPDLLEQKRLLHEETAVFIASQDICPACSQVPKEFVAILVKLPIQRGSKVYSYVGVTVCPGCAEAKDYNKIKRGLGYWLNEGKLEVLKDSA